MFLSNKFIKHECVSLLYCTHRYEEIKDLDIIQIFYYNYFAVLTQYQKISNYKGYKAYIV